MPVRELLFYTESQITATDPLNSSGVASLGPLFENTDDGNQDFDGGLNGTPGTFSIAGAPQKIAIDDEDEIFDDDSTMLFDPQLLTEPVAGYPVGSNVEILYSYTVSGSDGSTLTVYAIGAGENYLNDDFIGLVTSAPLKEGVIYTPTAYDPLIDVAYSDLAPFCFGNGTMIDTDQGPRPVEDLRSGDLVRTRDDGFQPITWIGRRRLRAAELEQQPRFRPIRIRAGALGPSIPQNDLIVSPQHRVLVRSRIAQRMYGKSEVLVPAKDLLELDGVCVETGARGVTYHHLLFQQHEIVFSNGAETESLLPGPEALKSVGEAALNEIFSLFPDLAEVNPVRATPARPIARGRQGRRMVWRHIKNGKPLLKEVPLDMRY